MVRLVGLSRLDLLIPARALHQAGYHVLMFDLRNHGRSGSSPTVTFGRDEANDVLGAVRYLQSRADVDADRIAALGYSMGANAVMFACAQTQAIKAAILVQPVRPTLFARRLSRSLLGPLSDIALRVARHLHYRAGGPLWETTDPAIVADIIRPTAVLYLQGAGDPWGDVSDVRHFYELTGPSADLQIIPSNNRLEGYLYLGEHPDTMLTFLSRHLTP